MSAQPSKRTQGYREIAKLRASMLRLEEVAKEAIGDLKACKDVSDLCELRKSFDLLLRAIAIRSRRGVVRLNAIGDQMDSKHKRRITHGRS